MDVEQVIREAIAIRSPVSLCYATTGIARRVVHPHALFRASTGKKYVDGYQVAGATSSGERIPDWRQMRISKITAIEILDGSFAPAPGWNPAAKKYSAGLLAHV